MKLSDETRIKIGRRLAAFSFISTIASLAVLLTLTGFSHVGPTFALHTAVLALGFGFLTWAALPTQPRNGALWALTWSGFFAALGVTGLTVSIPLARWLDPNLSNLDLEQLIDMAPADLPFAAALATGPQAWGLIPTFILTLTVGLLLFPDGKPVSPRWRWVVRASVGLVVVGSVLYAMASAPNSTVAFTEDLEAQSGLLANLLESITFPLMGLAVASVASVVLRYRRSTGETRQQIRWIALAGVVLLASVWSSSTTNVWFLLGAEVLFVAAFVIAITRYKVYAIDLVISKVVTYGLFALLIVLLYATLILTFISMFGDAQQRATGSLGLSLPMGATLIVAIAFEPLRQRLRRFANRVTYGKRAAPHEVLSQLASELADASQGGDLGGLARLLRDGTAAEYAAVWVGVGGRLVALAASPADSIPAKAEVADWTKLPQSELELVVPIHQADNVPGALQIRKSRSRPVTPADRELLADVAAGAGLLIRNMTLNTELSRRASELRASRRRLIAAQDAARHRLERDLHDGAQQQVVALKVKLGLAEAVARREGAESIAERVAVLAGQTQNAVDSMRAVARGIYPPLLEAEGLGTALRAVDRTAEIDVELRAADLPRYPREIEETAYFCVVSALSHGREAGATSAQVSIQVPDDGLFIEVSFDRDVDWVDSSILDRIEAFGGDIDAIERGRRNVLQLHLPVRVEAER